MRIAVPHNTSKEIARRKVEERLGELLRQFGDRAEDVAHEWSGHLLRFKGKTRGLTVEGTLEITDAALIIEGRLPLIAKPFESRIRQAVEREADQIFRV